MPYFEGLTIPKMKLNWIWLELYIKLGQSSNAQVVSHNGYVQPYILIASSALVSQRTLFWVHVQHFALMDKNLLVNNFQARVDISHTKYTLPKICMLYTYITVPCTVSCTHVKCMVIKYTAICLSDIEPESLTI